MKDLLDMEMISQTLSSDCKCLEDFPLAYAYVPYQQFESPYSMEQSLKCGTVFPRLNKPVNVYGKEFNTRVGAKL